MSNQIYKPLNRNSGLFQTIPLLTGNQKLVIGIDNTIAMHPLSEHETEPYIYNFSRSYGQNISGFAESLLDSDKFYYDSNTIIEQSQTLLDVSEYSSYGLQHYNRNQWGVYPINNEHNKFRFLAPIWLSNNDNLPKYFVILRKKKSSLIGADGNNVSSIIQNGELVKKIDLSESKLYSIFNQIITDSAFTNTPITFSDDVIITHGINISTGKYESLSTYTDNEIFGADDTILQDNNQLTELFETNSQVISNLLNIEFEFEIPVGDGIEKYDYFGIYTDEHSTLDLMGSGRAIIANTVHSDKNILSITDPYDGSASVRTSNLYESLYDGIKSIATIRGDIYNHVTSNITRYIELYFDSTVIVGNSIQIDTPDHILTVYASNQNVSSQFMVVENNLSETIDNIIAAFTRLIEPIDTLDFEFINKGDYLIIDSNTSFDVIPISINLPSLMYTNVVGENGILMRGNVEFPLSIEIGKTIKIRDWRSVQTLSNVTDIIFSTVLIDLTTSDGVSTEMNVVGISEIGNDLYIKLDGEISTSGTKPHITFKRMVGSIATIHKFLPISHIDKTIVNPSESRIYDFNVQDFAEELYNLNEDEGELLNEDEMQTLSVDITTGEFDGIYISELLEINSTTTDNPYDRLMEYDIQEHGTLNKYSNNSLKWCSADGLGAHGYPLIANSNIAFGLDGGSASQESLYDSYSNLDRSWFVIGTKPSAYVTEDDLRSYATSYIRHPYRFSDIHHDYFTEYLTHTIHYPNDVSKEIESFVIIKDRGADILGSRNGYALFRGVEYLFDTKLIGYKFAVVFVQAGLPEVETELLINDTFKTVTLLIQVAIGDEYATELSKAGFNDDMYRLDRSTLYNPSSLDTGDSFIMRSWKKVEFEYPQLVDNGVYDGVNYTSGYIEVDGEQLLKIKLTGLFDFSLQQMINGGEYEIQTSDKYGNSHRIDIVDVREVNVEGGYLWCTEITVTNNADNQNLVQSTDYASLNDKKINLPSQFSLMTATEETYALEISYSGINEVDRMDKLKLVNNIDKINELTSIDVSENDVIIRTNNIRVRPDSYSNELIYGTTTATIGLLRNTIMSTPLVQEIFEPLNYTTTIGNNTTTYNGCGISNEYYIPEFIIRKIGYGNTLLTDSSQTEIPIHWAVGETVLARTSNYVHKSIDSANNIRLYTDRNINTRQNISRYLVNYSGMVSTIISTPVINHQLTIPLNNGNYLINIYEILKELFSEQFNTFSDLELNVFIFNLLDTYDYKISFTDINGRSYDQSIQDVTNFNNLDDNSYIISGFIQTIDDSITLSITI